MQNFPFTQTKEYLSWHESVGTKTFYLEFFRDISESENFQIDGESAKEKYAIAACVVLNLRIGKVLYVPYGPIFFDVSTEEEKNKVIKSLHDLAQKENCVFVRLENLAKKTKKDYFDLSFPQLFYGLDNLSLFSFFPPFLSFFEPSPKTFAKEGIFQPRVEWWLHLNINEEELLNNIHKDHRYSIRRAEKELIQIDIINLNEELNGIDKERYFDEFWRLMKVTSERDKFTLYDKKYYEHIFHISTQREKELKKFVVFAGGRDAGKYLSVALVVVFGKVANLICAGSVSEKRELGFNHFMQWEAIKKAKSLGCEIYNFGGIRENINGQIYGKESLSGVTNFKKRFGGFVKFHGNFLDMPIKKFKYFLYIFRKMLY